MTAWCLTDTDSFICHIQSEDLLGELRSIAADWLDTSNFKHDHLLYSSINFCTLGKFKSETGDVPPTEFCGLRSKMYSLATLTGTGKGVPKSYVKRNVWHEQYLHVLNYWSKTTCNFRAFRSRNHRVTTHNLTKVCLSCFDDKRYMLPDAIHSLAYGHYRIPLLTGDDAASTKAGTIERRWTIWIDSDWQYLSSTNHVNVYVCML